MGWPRFPRSWSTSQSSTDLPGHRDHRSQHHRGSAIREVPLRDVRLRGRHRRGGLVEAGAHPRPVPRRGRPRGDVRGRHHPGHRRAGRHRRHRASLLPIARSARSGFLTVGKAVDDLRVPRARGLQLVAVPRVREPSCGQDVRQRPWHRRHGRQRRARPQGDRDRATPSSEARRPRTCAASLICARPRLMLAEAACRSRCATWCGYPQIRRMQSWNWERCKAK